MFVFVASGQTAAKECSRRRVSNQFAQFIVWQIHCDKQVFTEASNDHVRVTFGLNRLTKNVVDASNSRGLLVTGWMISRAGTSLFFTVVWTYNNQEGCCWQPCRN